MYVAMLEGDERHPVMALLAAYAAFGVLKLFDWRDENTFSLASRVCSFAQFAYTSECILRNEHRARYIAPLDFDEFLFAPHSTGKQRCQNFGHARDG